MDYQPYEWQNRLIQIFRKNGVIKAFAGTGKTYASILLLKDRGYNKIIIAVPTKKLKQQWLEELKKHRVNNAIVETFHILSKKKSHGLNSDILIVDECHRSTSPVFRRLYDNITYDYVLGLSATPNTTCLEYCGDIIIDVPLKDAQICDFIIYFHAIDLSTNERREYDEYTEAIRRYLGRFRNAHDEHKWRYREKLDSMIFKRRNLVYQAEARIPKAVNIIRKNIEKPTLVICKRIEQANTIARITDFPVYHSETPDEKALDDFHHDRIQTLLSVGMLTEGYDKRNIQCLIIVSTAITETYHIQSIGRALRLPDNAEIHILLARNTTDEKLLRFRNLYHHKIIGEFSARALKPGNPWIEQYYIANEYSIDTEGRIFQHTSRGKQYYKDNPITSELERIFNYRGGKFRITKENLVLAKRGGKVIPLGILQDPLKKIQPTTLKSSRDYT
jgi:superfamily II DNA or RNA helicase